MTLQYLPAGIKDVAADPKHPYFAGKYGIDPSQLVVFCDGDIVNDVIVASERNGFVKAYRRAFNGQIAPSKRHGGVAFYYRKGKVQIFIRKEPT